MIEYNERKCSERSWKIKLRRTSLVIQHSSLNTMLVCPLQKAATEEVTELDVRVSGEWMERGKKEREREKKRRKKKEREN
jgi:hypothetical protein